MLPRKPADNDDDIQMAVLNAVASSSTDDDDDDASTDDEMLDSELGPRLPPVDDSEDLFEEENPLLPAAFPGTSRSSPPFPEFREEEGSALSASPGDMIDTTPPSKRLWYGHLGFTPFSRWYRKRARLQKQTTALGNYLRRVFASTPMKRRFSSWAGKRSGSPGSPGSPVYLGPEGER